MIGDRVVSPSAIVYLIVKLRLKSPLAQVSQDNNQKPELDVDQIKRRVKQNEDQEEEFLKSRGDAESVTGVTAEYAHAPRWPSVCCPSLLRAHFMTSCRIGNHPGGLSLLMKNQTVLLFLLSKSLIYPMPDYPMPTLMKHYLSTTTGRTRSNSRVPPMSACLHGKCTLSATPLSVQRSREISRRALFFQSSVRLY